MHHALRLSLACSLLLLATLATAQTVKGGHSHSVAVTPDGRVYTWGVNDWGQLGDGTTVNRNIPTEVVGLTGAIAVSAGRAHTLVLKNDGTVWAFGQNSFGQVGDGTLTTRLTPVPVQGLANVVAIAAGHSHSIAIESDGTVWTWGLNSSGQLCEGTTVNSSSPIFSATLSPASMVRGGVTHTIALRPNGSVVACGGNTRGQLGDGTTTQRLSAVSVGTLTDATQVDAGEFHSVVLLSDGSVRTVGGNERGQLGDGTYTERHAPVAVPGLSGVSDLTSGNSFTMARKSNGEVWVWGYNTDGQVGDGTMYDRPSPVRTPSIPAMSIAVAAGFHDIVVTPDGVVRAWGWNARGQVGDATWTNRATPVAISGPGYAWYTSAPGFSPTPGTFTTAPRVSMTSSTPQATVRFTTDGTSPTIDSPAYTAPILVGTSTTFKAATFRPGWQTSVVTTATYTLNLGTLNAPTASPTGGTFTSQAEVTLSAGAGTSIRYTTDGSTPGATSPLYTGPVVVDRTATLKARAFHPDYTQSAVTSASFTIVVSDPSLSLPAGAYAGGERVTMLDSTTGATLRYTINGVDPVDTDPAVNPGTSIVLGNYTLKVRAFKTGCTSSQVVTAAYQVTSAVTAPVVAIGSSHSVALAPDSTVWAFGYNGQGQVGDGTHSNRPSPVHVAALTSAVAVAAGGTYSFALMGDGRVLAWGENLGLIRSSGQVA